MLRSIQRISKSVLRYYYSTTSNELDIRFQVLRSLLFVPGNSQKMLSKILTMEPTHFPDAFVPDLEDSVPFDQKDQAREITSNFLASNNGKKPYLVIPRVNATTDRDMLYKDLTAVIPKGIDAITIGKVDTIHEMDLICSMISQVEQENRVKPCSIKVIPTLESALACVNAFQIASSHPERLVAIAFGADDYAADLGFTRTTNDFEAEQRELFYVRSTLAVAARAANVPSLDSPFVNYKDPDMLLADSKAVKSIGFKGRFAIHPSQVPILNQVFGITSEELAYARRVVEAYEKASEHGRGSTQVDGRMVDTPVLKRCLNVIKFAKLTESRR
jgi:citrate lyase subunit beta/citryl-CoA lyase